MSVQKRWICWPTPDKVCVQGGCGYCDPYSCACGKRHTGSRKVSQEQVERKVEQLGLEVTSKDIRDGMYRRQVYDHKKEQS